MSTSPRDPAPPAVGLQPAPPGTGGWRTLGLVLMGVWATLLVLAVGLWGRAAFAPARDDAVHGLVLWLGAPFVLLALGLLWWLWRSAGHLRRGRREGWTALLVFGGVAVVQGVITARPLLAPTGTGTADPSAPPRELAGGLLVAIVLGAVSVAVALLGRRRSDAAEVPLSDRA